MKGKLIIKEAKGNKGKCNVIYDGKCILLDASLIKAIQESADNYKPKVWEYGSGVEMNSATMLEINRGVDIIPMNINNTSITNMLNVAALFELLYPPLSDVLYDEYCCPAYVLPKFAWVSALSGVHNTTSNVEWLNQVKSIISEIIDNVSEEYLTVQEKVACITDIRLLVDECFYELVHEQ